MRKVLLCTLYLASWVALQTCTGFYTVLPVTTASYELVGNASSQKDIMKKFGITGTGADAVHETFLALHAFIKSCEEDADNDKTHKTVVANEMKQVIKYRDYIDLPYLNIKYVLALGNNGTLTKLKNVIFIGTNATLGASLRMEVVGIDTFYNPQLGNTEHHIVFQFKHIIAEAKMKEGASPNTDGGYFNTVVRSLLVPSENVKDSGVIYKAILEAGVPQEVIMPVRRYLASTGVPWGPSENPYGSNPGSRIKMCDDKLWIPTAFELLGVRPQHPTSTNYLTAHEIEEAGAQTHLDGYQENPGSTLTKYDVRNVKTGNESMTAKNWWLASPQRAATAANAVAFCAVKEVPTTREELIESGRPVVNTAGIAPLFCAM
ncbi:MAG: hypothetical protein Ta2A_16600 [Treponemataceae bacterium]|nr:MAG: hypothetical protein Ta2A_16600 [Treponemataceae bacterium]